MKTHLFRTFGAVVVALLLLTPSAFAQTATTSTTLSSAVADTAGTVVVVATATNVEAGGMLFIDREAMDVVSVNTTALTARVKRGALGSRTSPHISGSLVYVAAKAQKTSVFRALQARGGTCTRANEAFLPQIDAQTGIIWDCPVGATLWAPINFDINVVHSVQFTLQNGAGATIDALLMRNTRPVQLTACRIVYDDATTGTVAAGSAQVGTTVGGTDIVAATNYENAKAVGTTTAMVVVNGKIAANTPILVRHTGVAVTQAGKAEVECDYIIR